MTWKYRYRRDCFPDDVLIERCNALGEEGWSMIGQPRWIAGDGVWSCFFKRTVSNREQLRAIFAMSPQETTP